MFWKYYACLLASIFVVGTVVAAQLVGKVVQYKDAYRLCYIRGPEGLLLGLAQEIS